MAYMNLNTFELVHDITIDGSGNEDLSSWVYVDDLIAPIVSELNKKGYRTTFSCSGHPERRSLYVSRLTMEVDDVEILNNSAYISFDDGISIPEDMIPPKWVYDKDCNSMYFYYDDIYPIFSSKMESNSETMQKNQIIMFVMLKLFSEIKKWPMCLAIDPFKEYFKIDPLGSKRPLTMVPCMFMGKLFKLPEYGDILFACSRVDELSISLSPATTLGCTNGVMVDEVTMSSTTMYNRLCSDSLSKITIIETDEKGN